MTRMLHNPIGTTPAQAKPASGPSGAETPKASTLWDVPGRMATSVQTLGDQLQLKFAGLPSTLMDLAEERIPFATLLTRGFDLSRNGAIHPHKLRKALRRNHTGPSIFVGPEAHNTKLIPYTVVQEFRDAQADGQDVTAQVFEGPHSGFSFIRAAKSLDSVLSRYPENLPYIVVLHLDKKQANLLMKLQTWIQRNQGNPASQRFGQSAIDQLPEVIAKLQKKHPNFKLMITVPENGPIIDAIGMELSQQGLSPVKAYDIDFPTAEEQFRQFKSYLRLAKFEFIPAPKILGFIPNPFKGPWEKAILQYLKDATDQYPGTGDTPVEHLLKALNSHFQRQGRLDNAMIEQLETTALFQLEELHPYLPQDMVSKLSTNINKTFDNFKPMNLFNGSGADIFGASSPFGTNPFQPQQPAGLPSAIHANSRTTPSPSLLAAFQDPPKQPLSSKLQLFPTNPFASS